MVPNIEMSPRRNSHYTHRVLALLFPFHLIFLILHQRLCRPTQSNLMLEAEYRAWAASCESICTRSVTSENFRLRLYLHLLIVVAGWLEAGRSEKVTCHTPQNIVWCFLAALSSSLVFLNVSFVRNFCKIYEWIIVWAKQPETRRNNCHYKRKHQGCYLSSVVWALKCPNRGIRRANKVKLDPSFWRWNKSNV